MSGAGDDVIYLNRGGDDLVEAGTGDDFAIKAAGGKLVIDLGEGADRLFNYTTAGAVSASGGAGRDWIEGGVEQDLLQGGMDADILSATTASMAAAKPPPNRPFSTATPTSPAD